MYAFDCKRPNRLRERHALEEETVQFRRDEVEILRSDEQLLKHLARLAVADEEQPARRRTTVVLSNVLLGDGVFAEFLARQLVAPITEEAFRTAHRRAFVNEGERPALVLDAVFDRESDEALRGRRADRLDANARIRSNLFVEGTRQVLVHEVDDLLRLGRSLLPLELAEHVFRVLAEDQNIEGLGRLHRRRKALEMADRLDVREEVQLLGQDRVEPERRTDA